MSWETGESSPDYECQRPQERLVRPALSVAVICSGGAPGQQNTAVATGLATTTEAAVADEPED
mgnify:CR=1 FL=1